MSVFGYWSIGFNVFLWLFALLSEIAVAVAISRMIRVRIDGISGMRGVAEGIGEGVTAGAVVAAVVGATVGAIVGATVGTGEGVGVGAGALTVTEVAVEFTVTPVLSVT